MTGGADEHSEGPPRPAADRPGAVEMGVLGLVSVCVIALQIILVRSFSVATYHHFVYLVVSTALLGFGASGTLLALLGERNDAAYPWVSHAALWGFAVTAPWALRLSAGVPVDLYYLLYEISEAARLWVATLVLVIPFFAGGLFIGAVLRRHRAHAGRTYAANLVGSGLGGVAVLPFFFLVDPDPLAAIVGIACALAAVFWSLHQRSLPRRFAVVGCAVALLASASGLLPWEHPVDQYKGLAFARRLEEQGDATAVAHARSPISRWDVYDAPSMHYTLFAGPGAPAPPSQLQVFRDGFLSGALFDIERAADAPILDWTPQSLAYELVEKPDVLILGGTTGVHVWLALRSGAQSVTVVHRDAAFVKLLRTELAEHGGEVFSDDRVRLLTLDPRNALSRLSTQFDLIHIAEAEGVPAAAAGLVSLQEDYLLTREAIVRAVELLAPGGVITATRGLYSPPRDNLRLFALFADAVGHAVPTDPGHHLLQARNYLAATTVLARDPITDSRRRAFVERAHELVMDVDYFPGIDQADLTEFNRVDGPESDEGSYFYHGGQAFLEDAETEFADQWIYALEPPSDDRPYFHNFFRLSSLPRYIEAYGHLWFSRLELGPVVVAATLVQAAVAGTLLILVPILVARRRSSRGLHPQQSPRTPTGWTVAHFGLIGLGFMALEMLFIQKTTLILGDPVYSAAAVITAILVWAGAGSALQGRVGWTSVTRITAGGVVVALLAVATLLAIDAGRSSMAALSPAGRFTVVLLLLGPVSCAMGWLFPAGVERLSEVRGEVGLALAVNGVASVVAAPLAVLVSSTFGFTVLLGLAAMCYAGVALTAAVWNRESAANQRTTTRRP